MDTRLDEPRLIVLRLVGGHDEGKWLAINGGVPRFSTHTPRTGLTRFVDLVATGDIEWRDDVPAEVFVPADRLALWHAEHAC